jgi:hypothetical protein
MLSAIVAPLAAGGVPVWVVSSYDGDLVEQHSIATDWTGLDRCRPQAGDGVYHLGPW